MHFRPKEDCQALEKLVADWAGPTPDPGPPQPRRKPPQERGLRGEALLQAFFSEAETFSGDHRKFGIEIETLFVYEDQPTKPISLRDSQWIMQMMIRKFGWKFDMKNGYFVELYHVDEHGTESGFRIFYELGWNNFELVTPAYSKHLDERLRSQTIACLNELKEAAKTVGAIPLASPWDSSTENTLILPDKRDEVWLNLDGPILPVLGHLASVHYNVELANVEEGMTFIRRLNQLFDDQEWPPADLRNLWGRYIGESHAGYEIGRYCAPPDESFEAYCARLAEMKVVMNRTYKNSGQQLVRMDPPPRPFGECQELVDLDLFLRSVWWWSRLRVRGGRGFGSLALEIRAVPRTTDADIFRVWDNIIRPVLGF